MTLLTTLALAAAHAGSGDEILARMDEAMTRGTDYAFEYTAVTEEPGKSPRTMEFDLELQGDKRLVGFTAPGDVKGTRVLVLERNQMYVYVPAYRKVRRVASHVTEQGFMGTAFSYEDISTARYAPVFEAELTSETHALWHLELTPREGVDTPYSRLEVDVDKTLVLPVAARLYGATGEHVKTLTSTDLKCHEDVCAPMTMKMVDHSRGDASTTISVKSWTVNTGLPDSRFTVRELQRGE